MSRYSRIIAAATRLLARSTRGQRLQQVLRLRGRRRRNARPQHLAHVARGGLDDDACGGRKPAVGHLDEADRDVQPLRWIDRHGVGQIQGAPLPAQRQQHIGVGQAGEGLWCDIRAAQRARNALQGPSRQGLATLDDGCREAQQVAAFEARQRAARAPGLDRVPPARGLVVPLVGQPQRGDLAVAGEHRLGDHGRPRLRHRHGSPPVPSPQARPR